jgi:hypothetical protein
VLRGNGDDGDKVGEGGNPLLHRGSTTAAPHAQYSATVLYMALLFLALSESPLSGFKRNGFDRPAGVSGEKKLCRRLGRIQCVLFAELR